MRADDLRETVCIVTGGGRGIGRFTAESLARRGARVAICSRTEAELAETTAAIVQLGLEPPLSFALDVSDPTSAFEFAAAVRRSLGPPGLLVNNAAALGPVGRLTEVDLAAWYRTLAINVGGVAAMCAAVVPLMEGGGAIINLSGGGIGGPSMATLVSAYTASKAAVVTLTEGLATEFAPLGVTVNAVAPGPVATRFTEPVLAAGRERAGELYEITLAQREEPTSMDPFVELVCYLASSRARWLTGRVLSARWDGVEDLEARRDKIIAGSLYTLRRIDDTLYGELSR